jgi:microcin C transport system substrate-binding protein
MNFENVQRGLIQKRKIFNDTPRGFSGIALNTRRAPWNDARVRQAFAHLLNRELLIQKIFFNEYVPLDTYHPGSIYQNPDNPKMTFDPNRAMALFREAGWTERDAQGRLVKGGRPLTVEVLYATQDHEPFLTIYQEDLRRVGIGLNLRLVTPETMFQLVSQRQFDTVVIGWGGLLFPNPETMFHSSFADVPNNNNLTGFKNARVDALLPVYDREFDAAKRAAIIREIDGIIANEHHYVLRWDAPFVRVAFWNKFGHPESYFTRVGDYTEPPTLWWIDPQKEQRLTEAMGNTSIKLPVGDTDNRFWEEYAARQKAASTGTSGTN